MPVSMLGGLFSMVPQFFKEMEWTSPAYRISEDRREDRALSMQARGFANLVNTAKSSGIHPLYALGNPGVAGPQVRSHVPVTGSARFPAALSPEDRRIKRLQGDWIQEQIQASRAARGGQGQPVANPDGSITYPLAEGATTRPLQPEPTITRRALRVEPYENVPLWARGEGPDGQVIKSLSSSLNADELNQVLIAAQLGWDAFRKTAIAVGIRPDRVGRWLYGVVRRAARKASPGEARRKGRRAVPYRPRVPLPR